MPYRFRKNLKQNRNDIREMIFKSYVVPFDKSHIKGKKVRLIKNAERIAIWAIFVSI